MKSTFLAASILLASNAMASGDAEVHWGYAGENGPDQWGKLKPEFSVCSTGKSQSPVNLTGFIKASLKPINIAYQTGGNEVINNGHTIQVAFSSGSKITVDDREFELKQYHFHAPSENLINGKSYPMEVHLVHLDKDSNIAVIGIMFEEGAENKTLTEIWPHMPQNGGDKFKLPTSVSAKNLLPAKQDYYRFEGSLTTPPCSEGVRWLVMAHPITASKSQIEQFTKIMHHPNNRPVQPLNARTVLAK